MQLRWDRIDITLNLYHIEHCPVLHYLIIICSLLYADKVQVVSGSGLHQRRAFVLSALPTGNFQVATPIICQGTPLVHDDHVGHGSQQQVVLVPLVGVPVIVINLYGCGIVYL